jgi:transposase InsO family protein
MSERRDRQIRRTMEHYAIKNAYAESVNGKFRDERLNEHRFESVAEAKAIIEAWRSDYNTVRPPCLARPSHAGSLRRRRLRGPHVRVRACSKAFLVTTDQGQNLGELSLSV